MREDQGDYTVAGAEIDDFLAGFKPHEVSEQERVQRKSVAAAALIKP